MTQVNNLSHLLVSYEQNSSVAVIVEMSESSWLVAGQVPGLERQPLKKLDPVSMPAQYSPEVPFESSPV
ncbi:hypothetical protein [Mesorhizobium sp. M1142]|uniref:hypothetical protein n=1 Tax=Mesorhizobium sp. M1142 TaxID=2957060 RepID=UPI00333DD9C6